MKTLIRQKAHWKASSTKGPRGRHSTGLEDKEEELHRPRKENGCFSTNGACKKMQSQQVTSRVEGEFQIKDRETILNTIIKENSPNLEKKYAIQTQELY